MLFIVTGLLFCLIIYVATVLGPKVAAIKRKEKLPLLKDLHKAALIAGMTKPEGSEDQQLMTIILYL